VKQDGEDYNRNITILHRVNVLEPVEPVECISVLPICIAEDDAIHFPDYTSLWILRTDASDVACGVVLFQVYVTLQGERIHQLIAVSSRSSRDKRSAGTYTKRKLTVCFTASRHEYLLRGTDFIIQTDHANLAWIGANQAPIVARWRIYMQGFNYQVQLIP
jgi:hypothetical protein